MSKLDNRVEHLERAQGIGTNPVTAIELHGVAPSPEGPVDQGAQLIWIVGSNDQFSRSDFDTEAEFFAAANECHERVYGKPMSSQTGTSQ